MPGDDRQIGARAAFALIVLIASLGSVGCRRAVKPTAPSAPPDPTLVDSRRLLDRGEARAAYERVSDVLLREPDNLEAIVLAAEILVASNQAAEAVTLLSEASSRLPNYEFELLSRAVELLIRRDQLWQASQLLDRLVALRPDDPALRRQAGAAFNEQGYRFDANEHFRDLAKLAPLRPDELWSLLHPGESYATIREIPDLQAPNVIQSPGVLNLVRWLYWLDDLRQARLLLEQTPAIKEERPAAMALYGMLLLESQLYEDLATWYAKSDASWHRYPEFWLAVGGLALQRRESELAVRAFAEAVAREPCDRTAVARLTQALEANGNGTAAAAFRERSEDLKGLDEMTGEILNNPRIAAATFAIASRELRKMGQEFEALSWELLGRQRQGLTGGEIRDDHRARRERMAQIDEAELLEKRLCGLSLEDYSADFLRLQSSRDTYATIPLVISQVTPKFVNVARPSGLNFKYLNADPAVERYFLLHQALGSGIACLDYDLDGNIDLYVAQGAGNPPHTRGSEPNLLARNLGAAFQEATVSAACDDRGYSMGLTAGDFNQDGFTDLVVGNMGRNQLLINQGDGCFRPHQGDAIWDVGKYTTGLAVADVTGDHLPDIYELNYTDDAKIFEPIRFAPDRSPIRLPGPRQYDPSVDRLFTSVGDGSMKGRELEAGGQPMRRYGLGLLVADIDRDGANEVFVGNDQTANNLWDPVENGPVGKMIDVAVIHGVAYGNSGGEAACMGIAAADFDCNGLIDLHVTNFDDEWSNQYMQSEDCVFTDLALPYGIDIVSRGMLGFGAQAIDYDNNSMADLVIGNGHIEDLRSQGRRFRMPTQMLTGSGRSFRATSVEGDGDYWQQNHLSRCLVTLDWNGDGRLDLAVTDLTEPLALLENRTETSDHWLQLRLVGTRSERDAIGATVTVSSGDQTRTGFVQSGDGYMGKNESLVHFGVGESEVIDRLEVRWPSGIRQQWTGVQVDQRLLVVEGDGEAFALKP